MDKFWFVACDHSVFGVDLCSEEALLTPLFGHLLVDCPVSTLAAEGLRGKNDGQVFRVAGLFLEQEAVIRAADLPKNLEPWDTWFWDHTRPVLQAIGWCNPKLGLSQSVEIVPTGVEIRFRSMLPSRPLARRA